jgi:UDP-2,3-diacylglucosamine pyrophosphatase LpxH
MKKYKSIFISDIHLGSKGCKAEELCEFLKQNDSENLFLVGDIIDGWRLQRKFYWPQSHTNVIRRILTAAKRDTNVVYIAGNHDEILRSLIPYGVHFGNIELTNIYKYTAVNGKTYIVMHGDAFDNVLRTKLKFLYHLGDVAYNILLDVNSLLQKVRNFFGMRYWSLSAYLKSKTKEAVSYLGDFEDIVTEYVQNKKADGIICGHIHQASIKKINDIEYMNDGDWVESCTALVEHHDGRWEIIEWLNKEKVDVEAANNSRARKQSSRSTRKSRTHDTGSKNL